MDRVAIPWLHVLNEHPSKLAQYEVLFNKNNKLLRAWFVNVLAALYAVLRSASLHFRYSKSVNQLKKVDILFVSHLLNADQINSQEDFYFGSLPELCAQRGSSSAVALIDQSSANSPKNFQWREDMVPRIALGKKIGFFDEIRMYLRLFSEALRMIKKSMGDCSYLKKRILREAAVNAISPASASIMRMSNIMLSTIIALKPKKLVVTYEGHSWERVFFATARRVISDIECIGYQHAVIFPHQHAMFRKLGRGYDPDKILTAGEVGFDRFKSQNNFDKVSVDILGTCRRFDYDRNFDGQRQCACLVIPDGIIGECAFLFDFALECAKLMPQVKFIMRLHPVITFSEVIKHRTRQGSIPSNFEMSERTFDEDLNRSRWALYRGSSAAIYAVCRGIRPIYVERQKEISIDPLFELRNWKFSTDGPKVVKQIIESDTYRDTASVEQESLMAVEYCKRYFVATNPSSLMFLT